MSYLNSKNAKSLLASRKSSLSPFYTFYKFCKSDPTRSGGGFFCRLPGAALDQGGYISELWLNSHVPEVPGSPSGLHPCLKGGKQKNGEENEG